MYTLLFSPLLYAVLAGLAWIVAYNVTTRRARRDKAYAKHIIDNRETEQKQLQFVYREMVRFEREMKEWRAKAKGGHKGQKRPRAAVDVDRRTDAKKAADGGFNVVKRDEKEVSA